MNQGKLEVVKQEMARVNFDILGISKLKWTGMGEFNSDDRYIYYCRPESLQRNPRADLLQNGLVGSPCSPRDSQESHESRQIGNGQTGDGESECRHSRISKLKWTGMGEFNSDDHYIYCRQESIRRNGVAIMVNKRV